MDNNSIYNFIIMIYNFIKNLCGEYPEISTIIVFILGSILLPMYISVISNRREGKIVFNKDLKEKSQMADKYMNLKDYKKALELYITIEHKVRGKRNKGYVLKNQGLCYLELSKLGIEKEENLNKSIFCFKQCKVMYRFMICKNKYEIDKWLANSYWSRGLIRNKKDNLKQAINIYKEAMKSYKKYNQKTYKQDSEFIGMQVDLASCYETLAEVEDAEKNLNFALIIYNYIYQNNENM